MMHRKKKPLTYIEPMPKKQLRHIIRQFEADGGIVLMGEEIDKYLKSKGVEASTLNKDIVMFNSNPGRAAVHEEMIHVEQFRKGLNDGSFESILKNEIAAQEELLARADEFELTYTEIVQTKKALKMYGKELRKYKKGGR